MNINLLRVCSRCNISYLLNYILATPPSYLSPIIPPWLNAPIVWWFVTSVGFNRQSAENIHIVIVWVLQEYLVMHRAGFTDEMAFWADRLQLNFKIHYPDKRRPVWGVIDVCLIDLTSISQRIYVIMYNIRVPFLTEASRMGRAPNRIRSVESDVTEYLNPRIQLILWNVTSTARNMFQRNAFVLPCSYCCHP